MKLERCDECEAILEELRNALAEMPPQIRKRYESDRDAFLMMVGGSEEDVARLEESGDKYLFRRTLPDAVEKQGSDYYKIQSAYRKMIVHRFQTGHRALFGR